jgi:hypothetical protein
MVRCARAYCLKKLSTPLEAREEIFGGALCEAHYYEIFIVVSAVYWDWYGKDGGRGATPVERSVGGG